MKKIHLINFSPNPLPEYGTEGSAGADVRADLSRKNTILYYGNMDYQDNQITISPMGRVRIPTGLAMEIPKGYLVSIRPRSGISLHKGLTLINAVSTIDSDYRGEIFIPVINLSDEPVTIKTGDRIAQLLLEKSHKIKFVLTDDISSTDRSDGGFGSTGL